MCQFVFIISFHFIDDLLFAVFLRFSHVFYSFFLCFWNCKIKVAVKISCYSYCCCCCCFYFLLLYSICSWFMLVALADVVVALMGKKRLVLVDKSMILYVSQVYNFVYDLDNACSFLPLLLLALPNSSYQFLYLSPFFLSLPKCLDLLISCVNDSPANMNFFEWIVNCGCVYFIVITTILLLYLLFLKEVVGCSSCNMWFTTTRSWIELKAKK